MEASASAAPSIHRRTATWTGRPCVRRTRNHVAAAPPASPSDGTAGASRGETERKPNRTRRGGDPQRGMEASLSAASINRARGESSEARTGESEQVLALVPNRGGKAKGVDVTPACPPATKSTEQVVVCCLCLLARLGLLLVPFPASPCCWCFTLPSYYSLPSSLFVALVFSLLWRCS